MDKERSFYPYEGLNPVIKPETVVQIFNPDAMKNVHERINSIHPDIDKCAFILVSVRKTLSGNEFDEQYYLAGLKTFLDGRCRELNESKVDNLEPYAVDFVRDLLGADIDVQSTKQARSLTEKILAEFKGGLDEIPKFDASIYPKLSDFFIIRSRTNLNNFRSEQPYIVKYLSKTTLRGKFTIDDRNKLRSMINGIVDGNKMFRVAQNKLYRKEFEMVDKTFSEFFKDRPKY